ncbi:MAG: bifunctional diaminohydroxyphosphoribosylaminopyrimidine deaminase/5-amino-6-(5-phosphoribosylamino)uracil reductase RibD [bacterium]|nr:bifunctional diaminohydroxyphosphoribosylaminopyrimidine deaminase/5-amino-6-(5-phosphoribosylamino)uracil reductase RibD [bacterium]
MQPDAAMMDLALAAARSCRLVTSPNPWVGCVIHTAQGLCTGATSPPGENHAEINALAACGPLAKGAHLYTTLEPCSHTGRTGPCVEAIIAAGIARVSVAIEDPDPQVCGRGIAALRAAGIQVDVGTRADETTQLLAPYIKHRRTGLPWVVLKLAATLDGRIAAPDASSRWITGEAARSDAHCLRAESDAVLVGAGTIRADDPQLTVRHWQPAVGIAPRTKQPRRVVLGAVSPSARVQPATQMSGPLPEVLASLGSEGVMQLLVEGGASTAAAFHRAGLVDHYVIYLAPALFGGSDAHPMFSGAGAASIDNLWRGEIVGTTYLGADLRIDLRPASV